jgi:hypothetical protein
MSKKTLNESTIRRFMGLAGLKPIAISSHLKENVYEAEGDEEMPPEDMEAPPEGEEEMPPEDAELPPEDAELPPEPEMDPEMDAEGGEGVEISPEQAEVIIALGDMLKAAMPDLGGEEVPMDAEMPPEDMEAPPEGEEEMLEAALAETDVEMSEEQVVQEVAKRVAARILKAKRAKKALAEALGNKK